MPEPPPPKGGLGARASARRGARCALGLAGRREARGDSLPSYLRGGAGCCGRRARDLLLVVLVDAVLHRKVVAQVRVLPRRRGELSPRAHAELTPSSRRAHAELRARRWRAQAQSTGSSDREQRELRASSGRAPEASAGRGRAPGADARAEPRRWRPARRTSAAEIGGGQGRWRRGLARSWRRGARAPARARAPSRCACLRRCASGWWRGRRARRLEAVESGGGCSSLARADARS